MKILNEWETLNAIQRGYSISRFGDGEFKVILRPKKTPRFRELCPLLKEILSVNLPKFMAAIPTTLLRYDNIAEPRKAFWQRFFKGSGENIKEYLTAELYGSAFISRADTVPEIRTKKYWSAWRDLCEGRYVVGVNNNETKGSALEPLEFLRIDETVIVSIENAWKNRDKVLREYPKDSLILLKCGVPATVYAYLLYKRGYQAIDVGRLGTGRTLPVRMDV